MNKEILEVLKNLKLSVQGKVPNGFDFCSTKGICKNVRINSTISWNELHYNLHCAFRNMLYSPGFPVESTVHPDITNIKDLSYIHYSDSDKYQNNEYGNNRIKLLDQLIEYYSMNEKFLEVLKNLKLSLEGKVPEGFTFNRSSGICYHLIANTKFNVNHIINPEMCRVFLELGYGDSGFPVESTIHSEYDKFQLSKCHNKSTDHYGNDPYGKVRLKLLDEMIEYYTE